MTIEQARAKRWTAESRAKQAAAIKQWQPWTKSTGAKTIEGSRVSAANGGFGRGIFQKIMAEFEAGRLTHISLGKAPPIIRLDKKE